MSKILLLETSTALCSAAIASDNGIAAYIQSDESRAHASKCAVFIDELLKRTGLQCSDLCAVAVSSGPGSYTGLRVGSSTAKGICFGASVPLIAVSTPEILVWQAIDEGLVPDGCTHIIPMIDARRMEVYTAVYSAGGALQQEIRAEVVEEGSFADILNDGPCLFIGDGALKCREVLNHPNARFEQCCPKASAMLHPALEALKEKRFESTAYFEPFYLKDFVATVSGKKLF
ncbi:MAG: tRNA (adenosine(37)-N6)-threonylcarbamoyltransferase complex dimerization subunit type 1 TsaB [Bacteroidales bacterium]|nr:tRNA (adenosine(37)-N6)-threonylcarbamoyltransferase complex dimerization subunit type 1 TsaB [Bacteroidales bacterium]